MAGQRVARSGGGPPEDPRALLAPRERVAPRSRARSGYQWVRSAGTLERAPLSPLLSRAARSLQAAFSVSSWRGRLAPPVTDALRWWQLLRASRPWLLHSD